ncbi:hypothetical protein GCM10007389_32130 [Pontibacter akesuensis]|nr:hypothetical protein GCM10007389_32130 [Pontibacter akesuensis]
MSLCVCMVLASGSVAAQGVWEQEQTVNFDYSSPLLLLQDGKNTYKLDSREINKIDSEWIDEVQVIKETSETEKYGEEGKYGVVILTFKKDVKEAKQYARQVRRKNEKVANPVPKGVIEK